MWAPLQKSFLAKLDPSKKRSFFYHKFNKTCFLQLLQLLLCLNVQFPACK